MNTSLVDSDELDTITSVDVSLGDRVNDVLRGLLNLGLRLGQHFHLVVVTHELVIKDRGTKLTSRSLDTVGELIIRADSIVAENTADTVFVEAAKQVEGVEGHEATSVEGVGQKLGNALNSGLLFVLHLVDPDLRDQVSVQGLDIGDHTGGGQHAGIGKLGSLRVVTLEDRVSG